MPKTKRLTTNDLIRWSCPCKGSTAPKPRDPSSKDRQLMYVHDKLGNDFEIWCMQGWLGFYFEFRISGLDWEKELSHCVYDRGYNDASIEYKPLSKTLDYRTTYTGEGTPMIYVGEILNVEHSNGEGVPAAGGGLQPKSSGQDFHVVYDYKKKLRCKVNTIGGKKPLHDNTQQESNLPRDGSNYHAILHAAVTPIRQPSDFPAALESDVDFRRLDDPDAVGGTKHLIQQEVDRVSPPIGYQYLESERDLSGCVIKDQSMAEVEFHLTESGIEFSLPALRGRSRVTFAMARSLFSHQGDSLTVLVDGQLSRQTEFRPTDSMVVADVPVDGDPHMLRIQE